MGFCDRLWVGEWQPFPAVFQVVDDSDLKKETADLKNEEAANSKVETQTTSKGGRPKRAPKSVKEEVSAAENEVKGDQTKQNSELVGFYAWIYS